MNIRKVKQTDKDEWLRMRVALWPHRPLAELQQELADLLTRQDMSPVFVIERFDGSLGGFLEANIRNTANGCKTNRIGYIEGWFVDADLRRQGWGRRLVETAEAWASAIGCTEMASDCRLDNTVSLKAHTALGYVEHRRLIHFKKCL